MNRNIFSSCFLSGMGGESVNWSRESMVMNAAVFLSDKYRCLNRYLAGAWVGIFQAIAIFLSQVNFGYGIETKHSRFYDDILLKTRYFL